MTSRIKSLDIVVNSDISDALEALVELQEALENIPDSVTTNIDLGDSDVQNEIDDIQTTLDEVNGETVEPDIELSGDGLDQIQTIQTTLDELMANP